MKLLDVEFLKLLYQAFNYKFCGFSLAENKKDLILFLFARSQRINSHLILIFLQHLDLSHARLKWLEDFLICFRHAAEAIRIGLCRSHHRDLWPEWPRLTPRVPTRPRRSRPSPWTCTRGLLEGLWRGTRLRWVPSLRRAPSGRWPCPSSRRRSQWWACHHHLPGPSSSICSRI